MAFGEPGRPGRPRPRSRPRPTSAISTPVRRVLSLVPDKYDDMWTGAKGFYKVEPVVADGGQVVLYAPHIREIAPHPSGHRPDRLSLPRLLREAVGPLRGPPLGRSCALDPSARRRHLRPGYRRTPPGDGHPGDWNPRGPRQIGQPRLSRPRHRRPRGSGRPIPTRSWCPTPAKTFTGSHHTPRLRHRSSPGPMRN